VIEALLGALLGGVGFRLRGSAWVSLVTGRGATTARILCWAMPLAALAWVCGLVWWGAVLLALGLWAGCLAPWWDSLDLGRVDGALARDLAMHAARGVLWAAPAALALLIAGAGLWWIPLAASLACTPAYALGWAVVPARATEVGEVLFGAALGAAVLVAV